MKKKMLSTMVWIAGWLLVTAGCAGTGEFYVAPDGNDDNAGTKAKPFATLERARDAVRAAREAGAEVAVATVWLRSGNYFLSETFRLDDRDSGMTFRAAAGEEPVVYGGTRITGWRSGRGTSTGRRCLWANASSSWSTGGAPPSWRGIPTGAAGTVRTA